MSCLSVCVCVCVSAAAVPTLLEAGCQQASDHAATAEEIQEPNHPGLQDSGFGAHQHGRGIIRGKKIKGSDSPYFQSSIYFHIWEVP